MAPNTRCSGKSLLTAEQEQHEQRLKSVEDFMVCMSSMVETLVQNQSQPMFLTGEEKADILWTRHQAEQRKTAAELATGGGNTATRERSDGE